MKRTLVIIWLSAFALNSARADDDAPATPIAPAKSADGFLAAWRANDEHGMRAAAGLLDPDGWVVAQEILSRGDFDGAEAFARNRSWQIPAHGETIAASPTTVYDALSAYVDSRKQSRFDRASWDLACRAEALEAAGSHDAALAATTKIETTDRVIAARAAYVRAVALVGLGRGTEALRAFVGAAEAAEALGWLGLAARCWAEALPLAERAGDRASTATACLRGGVVVLRHVWVDFASARATPLLERAVPLFEALGDRVRTADALEALFDARTFTYDADALLWKQPLAVALLERARALRRELGDPLGEARVLTRLAASYEQVEEFRRAVSYRRAALALEEERTDWGAAAKTLEALAGDLARLKDRAGSLRTLEQIRALRDRTGTLDERVAARRAMSDFHWANEDFDEALASERAIIEVLASEKEGWRTAESAERIGMLLRRLGRPREALEALRRAKAIKQRDEPREPTLDADCEIAFALEELGEYGAAIEARQAILETYKHIRDGFGIGARDASEHIALDLARLGRYEQALALVEPLVAGQQLFSSVVDTMVVVARIRLAQGDAAGALAYARQIIEKVPRDALRENLLERVRGDPLVGTDALGVATLAAIRLNDASAACQMFEFGKARGLSTLLAERSTTSSTRPTEELVRLEALARAQEASAGGRLREAEARPSQVLAEVRERRAEFAASRETHRRILEAIGRSRVSEAGHHDAMDEASLRDLLASDEALVLYSTVSEETAALVLTRSEGRLVSLGKSATVEAACAALDLGRADASADAAVAALRSLVVAPLALGETVRRVLVSPDGALGYVPFGLLLGDREVACVQSGTAYGLLRQAPERRKGGVLALGDPDYATHGDARALEVYRRRSGGRLARLPGSAVEARAVADVVLLRANASERSLKETLAKKPRWSAVHLACHGLFDAERPMLSSLAVTPTDDDDGFLTVADVLGFEIPADLVVLSACETGKGKSVRGEGILGLTRAFMLAGAPRIICSLWKVDDDATRALMVKFYELWNPKDGKPGLPTATALKQAQEFVRSHEKWKHPYYWAAWVLWGLPS